MHEKFENNIEDIHYVDEHLLHVILNFESKKLHIISIYAPDINKPKDERLLFFQNLQNTIDQVPNDEKCFIMGDTNARIGNNVIPGVMQRFNEDHINENGELLLDLCAGKELRINNTFFEHKWQHKYTWSNTRGQESIIDFVITNRNVLPSQIVDIRTLNSANVGTDHNLVLCKYRAVLQLTRKKKTVPPIEKYNIESFMNEGTKHLYQQRLLRKIQLNQIHENDNVNQAWYKLKDNITSSAMEAIGKRTVRSNGRKNTKPWFTEEVKTLANEKRAAYIHYRSNKQPDEYNKYKIIRNKINSKIKTLKKNYWEKFSNDMQHDFYGTQKKIWNILRNQKKPINEYVQTTQISKDEWVDHFKNLYASDSTLDKDTNAHDEIYDNAMHIEEPVVHQDELRHAVSKLKNRKSPGPDHITNEMLKYGGEALEQEILKLFNKIPDQWRTGITIPIFKKGSKKNTSNYRGISLLCSMSKLLTKIISEKLSQTIKTSEEQQGFRRNRSTVDAIFVLRQLVEKAIEFDRPLFLCFVDLKQAFDRVQLNHVVNILKHQEIDSRIVEVIRKLNTQNSTFIKIQNTLSEQVQISKGIRQGDSLSPTLFNLIMDQIIQQVKNKNLGYQMHNTKFNILCYADDAVLMADNENDLQRLLLQFQKTAQTFNMEIHTEKTCAMVISKEAVRCKLAVYNKPIKQVSAFKYLGIDISNNRNLTQEVRSQANRAATISGCLQSVIWKNKYINTECKVRIYKACVRPTLTYAIETRAETSKTKALARTTELKTLRSILGVSLFDHIRNEEIRQRCGVQDIVRWARVRRRQWRDHVDRMSETRMVKQAGTKIPYTKRPPGRPPKRWKDSWTSVSQEQVQTSPAAPNG